MKEKRIFRMKQYRIWICLLAKRLWKQPVYIGLLLSIPLMGYAVGILERGERSGATVAICVEEGTWSEQICNLLTEQETDSVLRFAFCEERGEAEQRVVREEADCGFVIAQDIEEKVLSGRWAKSITVYETSTGSITGIAKERIAGAIFRLYSEARYEEYMEQISQASGSAVEESDLQKPDVAAIESAAEFAMKAYENHLEDDTTFGFRYLYDDSDGQNNSDGSVVNDNIVKTAVFPIKGVFAVLLFVGGMCGMLEYDKDEKEKRFLRLAPNILTYLVNIWIFILFLSAAVLLCLWISDGIQSCGERLSLQGMLTVWDVGMWIRQVIHLLIYQCIIMLYCVILRVLLRRRETIAAAIPILTLGSLVCSPVFIRMGNYLPVFTVLEKLFPATYYLLL